MVRITAVGCPHRVVSQYQQHATEEVDVEIDVRVPNRPIDRVCQAATWIQACQCPATFSQGSIDFGDDIEMIVSTADERFVKWDARPADPFRGTFETGGFPDVETTFSVRLQSGPITLALPPDQKIRVRP